MKKSLLVVILGLVVLALVSCNSDKSKIKTVITSFFTALNHKDPQSAKLYATKESGDFLNLIHQQILQTNNSDTTQNMNEKILVTDIKVNGDIATASVRSESQKTPLTVTVKKENGEWKVAFDKSSIATMIGGTPGQFEKGDTIVDSSTNDKQDQSPVPTAPGQTLNLSDTSVTPANNVH